MANTGTISASGGPLVFEETVSEGGTIAVGSLVVLDQGIGPGAAVDFIGKHGVLDIGQPSAFAATIHDFARGDAFDLLDTGESSFDFRQNTLNVLVDGATVASLQFAGHYTKSDFRLVSDHEGGTIIKLV